MEEEIPKPIGNKIDEKWYDRFSKVASFQPYEYLSTEPLAREKQKELFLRGQAINPEFNLHKIDPGDLDLKADLLFALKRDIIQNEADKIVAQAYRWRINEKIAELFLLKSAATGDMRKFKRWSEFIYGKPSKDVFDYTIGRIRLKIDAGLKSENLEIQEAAQNLLDVLGGPMSISGSLTTPTEEEASFARKITKDEFKDIINIAEVDPKKKFNSQEIKEYFEKSLEVLNLSGWKVEIETGGTSINVGHEDKSIKIPEARTLTARSISKLILHEIGTHIVRRENGERSRLMLLGLGLDRYLKGEEGIATMREQVSGGGPEDFAGFNGHLAIGLVYGYAGKPLDFRGTYEVLEKYFLLNSLLNGEGLEKSKISASNNAWNNTLRVFWGADCKTPGVCFTQDIVYREGNIGVWGVIRENPDEMHRFSVGKYDPSNLRHIWILSQLGIDDDDLQISTSE